MIAEMAGSSKDSQESSRNVSQSNNGKKISIGNYTINYCPGVPFQPLTQVKEKITEVQQAILNNIWFFRNDNKGFLQSLNILSHHFAEINKFGFYVVFRGRRTGIFSTWQETVECIEGFPNPIFKGYFSYDEAYTALRMFFENQKGFEPILEFNGCTYCREQVKSFMGHFKNINEARHKISEDLEICKKDMTNLLVDLQQKNKTLKEELARAELLIEQFQKMETEEEKQKRKVKGKEKLQDPEMERPLDIINITLMRDQSKILYKAVETLPNDIKQSIFSYARDDNLKHFLKIQKFLAQAVGLPQGMTTLFHKGNINYEYPFKFMTAQIHLDDFPMNFDIPELGQVGIEELFSYGIIDAISAFSIIKIHFLPEKLQQSIRMFGGKHGFCLDIDSIPCEWIISQPYKFTIFLSAYHYIVIVPSCSTGIIREDSSPADCLDMCPEYLQR
ncbi:hypothetical protein Ddye_019886 [Dipteronia dyeriana]|uniref:Ribonuclease H1 N-terminal domain-containing protein n=1 Tax=Dipteronia dyeriana TaxID=168575 RepID=A0AAD9TZ31_9ROSI|nr:hypothetical protein Ddye_019886 [Dipteronia dyeriana]